MTRKTKYYPNDPRDLPGDNFKAVKAALTNPLLMRSRLAQLAESYPVRPAQAASEPNTLVQMLALTPEQAKHLEGCDRLNFWRNGSLHVQVNHGGRGIKLTCPQAIISDSDLTMFFLSWGWQQVSLGKLYFKPTASSLVRL